MSKFGIEWQINRYYWDGVADNWVHIGGISKPARPQVINRELMEPGTGQREIPVIDVAETRFRLELELLLQRIEGYLQDYAIPTAEGSVPDHTLHFTDGIDNKEMQNCKVGRCEFRCRHGELIKTALTIAARDLVDNTQSPSWDTLDERILSYKKINTISIDGVAVTNWEEVGFGVDHHLEELSLGTDPKPSDIGVGEADYFFDLRISRQTASKLGDVRTGSSKTIVVEIEDNQPKTATFTFSESLLTLSRLEIPGLGHIAERIEAHPRKMTLSVV